jgi:Fuc2NAc and GlcNAc transferase
MTEVLLLMLFALAGTALLTGLMRRYALAQALLDIPNARSSHQESTPRGGGLAMVVSFAVLLPVQYLLGALAPLLLIAVLPALLVVAGVGFWDDHQPLSAGRRITVHFVAIAWALYWLGGPLLIALPLGPVVIGWPAQLLALLALVWFLNLFNFMDGIDGIAAGEAVFVAFAGAWLAAMSGLGEVATMLLVLGAAALGFLPWNWPSAKIFMGDVGSGFLGAALGVLVYAGVVADGFMLWAWIILVGVFVTDATLTLGRRMLRGERWYEAHCSHAYQHAARRWGHLRTTAGVLGIDVAWLLPMALLAATTPAMGLYIAALAYLPLILLALWLGAGITGDIA